MAGLRPVLNIVADIGRLGFELQRHDECAIAEGVAFLRKVNPELFSWIVQALGEARATNAVDPSAQHRESRERA